MDELPQIERTTELPAGPPEVWERIVDGDLAEEWMGVRIEPRVGGDVVVPGKDVIGTVEQVDPERSITWSWRETDGDPSQVTIEIAPTETGTEITVTERLLEFEVAQFPPVFLILAA